MKQRQPRRQRPLLRRSAACPPDPQRACPPHSVARRPVRQHPAVADEHAQRAGARRRQRLGHRLAAGRGSQRRRHQPVLRHRHGAGGNDGLLLARGGRRDVLSGGRGGAAALARQNPGAARSAAAVLAPPPRPCHMPPTSSTSRASPPPPCPATTPRPQNMSQPHNKEAAHVQQVQNLLLHPHSIDHRRPRGEGAAGQHAAGAAVCQAALRVRLVHRHVPRRHLHAEGEGAGGVGAPAGCRGGGAKQWKQGRLSAAGGREEAGRAAGNTGRTPRFGTGQGVVPAARLAWRARSVRGAAGAGRRAGAG
jgi:hypothetical protein